MIRQGRTTPPSTPRRLRHLPSTPRRRASPPYPLPTGRWRTNGALHDGPRADVARLYLNLGRKDGASEREIRSLLESRAPGASVADVDVMNTHTYLNVAPADAERIIAAVAGQELGGRQLICESAKPRRR